MTLNVPLHLRGGGFLLAEAPLTDVVTPEDLDAEAREIGRLAADFARQEVLPRLEALEAGEHELSVELLRKAGELGLLAGDIPAAFGGLGLSKATTTLITEQMALGGSFAVTFGGHTGIGTLPIVLFGTPEQKQRYLPSLARGERIAAYALTEPEAGSDALSGRTRADLASDGKSYRLNGQKQWITNSGFADLFIVYAKVDGERFTAFIVERGFGGIRTSPEFRKMGLKGSSTRTVFFEDTPVPAENVLGEVGRGHLVAFNTLNIGRWKLAAGCIGSCKALLSEAATFAVQRHQFGRAIAGFPLIQQKLARMAAVTYALESMVYRTAGLFDTALAALGDAAAETGGSVPAVAEYAVEASINKVFGSEALDEVVDEAVQIHGGYGYMQDYAVERAYRDARINRIFEGTNEINRLLIPGTLLRRALRGELPLLAALRQVERELADPAALPSPGTSMLGSAGAAAGVSTGALAALEQRWQGARKVALALAGLGAQKFGPAVEDEQEFLAAIADLVIALFATSSALLRARKAAAVDPARAELHAALARLYAADAFDRMELTARRLLPSLVTGDALRVQLALLRRLLAGEAEDTVALGRRVAQRVLEREGYPLGEW